MKKVLLGAVLVGVATFANAQKSEVADAKKEWNLFQIIANGKTPLDKKLTALQTGLKHTDLAIVHEKSKNLTEAWSYRALFSSTIAVLDTVNVDNSIKNQAIAEEAIVKAKALDTKGEEKTNIENAEINALNAVKIRAFAAYNKQDFAGAMKYFNEVTVKNPNDTAMYLNAGIMARNIKNYPETVRNFKKLISFNTPTAKDLYGEVINITLTEIKDTVDALALIKEASAKYPDAENFTQLETQLYMNQGNVAKSIEMLDKLLAKNPNNANYQYLRGDIYYQQAVEVQNRINKISDDAQKAKIKLTPKQLKESETLRVQLTGLLDKALPYYLKSAEIDPKYAPALEALKRVYAFKNDTVKYDAVKKQLDALTPANK
ncbi:tetratricopeptide repeat protein [Pedobacter sp. MC2016-14]|uniref:tetratricopeptide repeat protein n=1 Tax=Pedobacter sp. MC2016-14 TaxID=2897327 RepID=UPI001E56CD8D|nr:tetratricopeptide repeat protein [Pedobacter sp. MC2016-14]MCD0490013.1 tetratricopeptide repeat protein [Pedobacter sp. MC2016-14]